MSREGSGVGAGGSRCSAGAKGSAISAGSAWARRSPLAGANRTKSARDPAQAGPRPADKHARKTSGKTSGRGSTALVAEKLRPDIVVENQLVRQTPVL